MFRLVYWRIDFHCELSYHSVRRCIDIIKSAGAMVCTYNVWARKQEESLSRIIISCEATYDSEIALVPSLVAIYIYYGRKCNSLCCVSMQLNGREGPIKVGWVWIVEPHALDYECKLCLIIWLRVGRSTLKSRLDIGS